MTSRLLISGCLLASRAAAVILWLLALAVGYGGAAPAFADNGSTPPAPLLKEGHPVDWWFVFKFNAKTFPSCGGGERLQSCAFGGVVRDYPSGQQFVVASSEEPNLKKGGGCVGGGLSDPLGATFDQVYNGALNYVLWNDQFYRDPPIRGCGDSCGTHWIRSFALH